MKLLLVSHGELASGLLGSFDMIAGKNKDISAISLTDEGISHFSKKLKEYLEEYRNDEILILCDIKGGTPFNEAYREYLANSKRIKIITGMNLPMLIEIGMIISQDVELENLSEIGVSAGITAIEGIVEETEANDEELEF